ncbi:hypothetical protein FBU30_005499 [Linnemannia zychae]|nr:hypothetical protein FBU30_005499 [Linnemannia zychae]
MFSNKPHPEDVVRLPEIVALLGPYLKAPDLFSCIQVCHLWNDLLTPWLWHSIDDSLYSWPKILSAHKNPESQGNKDKEWIRTIFTKYGHHIRKLTTQWGVILEIAETSGQCNQLESLSLGDLSASKTIDDEVPDNHDGNSSSGSGANTTAAGMVIYSSQPARPVPTHIAATGPLLSPIFEGVLEPIQARFRTVARQLQDWATIQYFWLLVRQNRHSLFSLRLDVSLNWLGTINHQDFIIDTLASLENLVNLEDDALGVNPNILLDRLPGLLSYRCWTNFVQNDNQLTRSFSQLIYLELWGRASLHTFFTLLKHLPNLETLRMDEFQSVDNFNIQGNLILDNVPSRLKILRFRNPNARIDEQVANLVIPWIPHLIEISLTQLHPTTARALGTHCRKLEVVKQIDEGFTLFSHHVSSKSLLNTVGILLRECASLKVFDGIHHTIEASHMLQYPWACQNLETFRCQIIGIPRMSPEELEFFYSSDNNNNNNNNNSLDRSALLKFIPQSHELQSQVMTRLASLTHLKVLDLGYEYRDIQTALHKKTYDPEWTLEFSGQPIQNSLELTLETGLDQLAHLKDLEVFGFEGINHRIGKPELEWMAKHWPKLKILRGLHKDDLGDGAVVEDKERTKLREYMQTLRIDVRHATLRPKVKF